MLDIMASKFQFYKLFLTQPLLWTCHSPVYYKLFMLHLKCANIVLEMYPTTLPNHLPSYTCACHNSKRIVTVAACIMVIVATALYSVIKLDQFPSL